MRPVRDPARRERATARIAKIRARGSRIRARFWSVVVTVTWILSLCRTEISFRRSMCRRISGDLVTKPSPKPLVRAKNYKSDRVMSRFLSSGWKGSVAVPKAISVPGFNFFSSYARGQTTFSLK
jgi:hypothetical protein